MLSTYFSSHIFLFSLRAEKKEASGGQVRGRPRLGWMDGVMVALCHRGAAVDAAGQCAKDRKEWIALVHM